MSAWTPSINQYEVEAENMGDALNYLEDGMTAEVVFYDGKAISVELPTSVEREITWTEPAVKGDTSGKVLKPAKIATGFRSARARCSSAQGDKIEIDTRTGEYRKRVMPTGRWLQADTAAKGFPGSLFSGRGARVALVGAMAVSPVSKIAARADCAKAFQYQNTA